MSCVVSGSLIVGMRGPYACVQLRFSPIQGLDFSAAQSLALTLRITGPLCDVTVAPEQWTWSGKTAVTAVATWFPDGHEFARDGYHHFAGVLVADGQPVDLRSFDEYVERA